jgi:hypothetical protein
VCVCPIFFNKKIINVKTFNFILTPKKAKPFKIFVYIGVVYNEKKYIKKIAKRKSKFQYYSISAIVFSMVKMVL